MFSLWYNALIFFPQTVKLQHHLYCFAVFPSPSNINYGILNISEIAYKKNNPTELIALALFSVTLCSAQEFFKKMLIHKFPWVWGEQMGTSGNCKQTLELLRLIQARPQNSYSHMSRHSCVHVYVFGCMRRKVKEKMKESLRGCVCVCDIKASDSWEYWQLDSRSCQKFILGFIVVREKLCVGLYVCERERDREREGKSEEKEVIFTTIYNKENCVKMQKESLSC